jgi:hypothetical protein
MTWILLAANLAVLTAVTVACHRAAIEEAAGPSPTRPLISLMSSDARLVTRRLTGEEGSFQSLPHTPGSCPASC